VQIDSESEARIRARDRNSDRIGGPWTVGRIRRDRIDHRNRSHVEVEIITALNGYRSALLKKARPIQIRFCPDDRREESISVH